MRFTSGAKVILLGQLGEPFRHLSALVTDGKTVQLDIRSFKNTDARQICNVWNEHQAAVGLDCPITLNSFELCILAKPYFDPALFFVAELDGKVAGFAHLGFGPAQDFLEIDTQQAILCCLCVQKHELDARIAAELLAHVAAAAKSNLSIRIQTIPTGQYCPFYIGLAPGDAIAGILAEDVRLHAWLSEAGFKRAQDVTEWEVDTADFHPPVDRVQIQIRRMAHVDRRIEEPELPWWIACVLGHTDQVGFQLTLRKEKKVACEAFLWTIDHEVNPYQRAVARLWTNDSGISPEISDHYVFLLSEAFRQLFVDRIRTIRAFTSPVDTSLAKVLQRVGMVLSHSGTVYSKQLA